MRRAPRVVAGVLGTLTIAAAIATAACRPSPPPVDTRWTLDPFRSSVTEPTHVRLALTDPVDGPVSGARLQLEAQMSHPGMPAIVVPMIEASPGVYEADVHFSMHGDWVLTATGDVAGGRRISTERAVPDVSGER